MAQIIQLRRGTSAQWLEADPVLAEGEIGVELPSGLFKFGDGIRAWSELQYSTLRSIDEASVIRYVGSDIPEPPSANSLNCFSKSLSGRMMLRQQGPSGLSTPLQPAFFQNNIVMINASVSTALGTIGNSVSSVGTISHPSATELYGWMANFASAATALATCGTGNNGVLWVRGSIPNSANGFFFNARLAYPDSSYNENGVNSGTRTFVGLTNQTMAVSVALDNPVGHFCGFMRRHTDTGAKDITWKFVTKNNVTLSVQDTGLVFYPEKVYDFYIFCAPNGDLLTWRIDNVTNSITAEGSTSDTLPGNNIYMRAGFQLQTVNAVARNIRMSRVYTESDR